MANYFIGEGYDFSEIRTEASLQGDRELEVEFTIETIRDTKSSQIFQAGAGGSVVSLVVIDRDIVYFGACDGNIYAVELDTGRELWRFSTGGPVVSSVAVESDRIYAASYDGNLYALDMKGNLIWRFGVGDKIASSPFVHKDNIYFGCRDGNVYAVNNEGNLIWRFATNGPIGFDVVVCNETIYAGSFDHNIYAINMNGSLLWKYAARDSVGRPNIHKGTIYFGCFDHCVYAVDTKGKLLWRFQTNEPIPVGTIIAVSDDVAYFGSRDNNLYAVKDGQLVWRFGTGNMVVTNPLIEDNTLYFGSADGNLYAVNTKTGRKLWQFKAGGPVSYLRKSGDIICFSCFDCNLYAITVKGELLWKFHTSMDQPATFESESETEHTIIIPSSAQETRKTEGKEDEMELGSYGDFRGSYIQDDMRDYIGKPIGGGGPGMAYKSGKRVYRS